MNRLWLVLLVTPEGDIHGRESILFFYEQQNAGG